MSTRPISLALALLGLAALGACGGGGGGGDTGTTIVSPPPVITPPPPVTTPSFVHLTSDTGDYVGGGATYSYTNADAFLTVTYQGGHLSLAVTGNESWQAEFQLPNTYTALQVGTYNNLARYPFQDPAIGGLDWSGQGRGCGSSTASLVISKVVYSGTALTEIALQFTQYCSGSSAALRGDIYWNANDNTRPPGPALVPASLWQPAAGATPASGNYVYLESQPGDYVGGSGSYLYTQANSALTATLQGLHFAIGVAGNQQWSGDFKGMSSLAQLTTGYYGELQRYPFNNPTSGGLNWTGEGRGCNTLTGWFAIDNISIVSGALKVIDLRFEQRCEGGTAALHGKIHWDASDPTVPPGPQWPPPANLWQPAASSTPATGNYVYLESQSGDFIGGGNNYLYTQTNSLLRMDAQARIMQINVTGNYAWNLDFAAMSSLVRLESGYYGNLQRYPFNNPATGGLAVDGRSSGCNTLAGWFIIDNIAWSGTTLVSVDLRFEQHCEGATPALHGKIHWDSSDTSTIPGPVTPAPANLWQPAAGATPASGNYVYLESQLGDPMAGGNTYLYTQADAVLNAYASGASVVVNVQGDQHWNASFAPMSSLTQLQPGYYDGTGSQGFITLITGSMNWGGEGRFCSGASGWFVVDSVTYSGTVLSAIDIRFEQHCGGSAAALRGKIHWTPNDSTRPPGPVVPPPANLWEPAPGATPASGNYVYLASDLTDVIGRGQTLLYTPSNSTLTLGNSGAYLSMDIATGTDLGWHGEFQGMNSISTLQPGYYGGALRYPFGNPTKGSFQWGGQGRACNTLTGWFVIDNVTYTGSVLTAIDLRFEQHCDGVVAALHGKIHWGP